MPLRVKGIVLAAIPILAIIVSASFSYLGNRQRERAETDVTRHFELVTDLEELLTLVVNAETGMRGYLLTRRVEFLQPYGLASQTLPSKMAKLRAVVQREPGLNPRMEKSLRVKRIQTLVNEQMKALATLRLHADSSNNSPHDLYQQLEASKNLMDKLRGELRLMRVEEKRLLAERLEEIVAVRRRDYLAIGVALLLSLIGRFLSVYLFNTGVVHRVQRLKENVHCLGQGLPILFEPSAKADTLTGSNIMNTNTTKTRIGRVLQSPMPRFSMPRCSNDAAGSSCAASNRSRQSNARRFGA